MPKFLPTEANIAELKKGVVEYDENLAGKDPETDKAFMKSAAEGYEQYSTDRKEYEKIWKVLDYMYKGAQNRTIYADEQDLGLDSADENAERANTGSLIFHRLVRQNAATGMAIQRSRPVPFKYVPIVNESVWGSHKEAEEQAEMANLMAEWIMKKDNMGVKSDNFWHMVAKDGCVVEFIYQKRRTGRRRVQLEKFRSETGPNGIEQQVFDGYDVYEDEFLIDNYPCVYQVPLEMCWMDYNLPDIAHQDLVLVGSLKSISEIIDLARQGIYSMDAIFNPDTGLKEKHFWDGVIGGEHKSDDKANEGHENTSNPSETGMIFVWDIFQMSPIDEASNKWEESKAVPRLFWGTVLGNSPRDGVMARLEDDFDADGEIPGNLTNYMPGDGDKLIHVSPGQVIRSNYSVECSLKNLALDNSSRINSPMLFVNDGLTDETDFTVTANKVVFGSDVDKMVKQWTPADITHSTTNLLQWVQEDTKFALSAEPPVTGDSYGSRTSALEASNAHRAAMQTHMASTRYVLDQRFTWIARKYLSYMRRNAEPEQVMAITDKNNTLRGIRPGQLYGEFDIEIDIVDEMEDSIMQLQSLNEMFGIITQSPEVMQRVDIGAMLEKMFRLRKIDPTGIIIQEQNYDSEQIARGENQLMSSGQPVQIKPGEKTQVHLAIHKAERMRYNGVEEFYPHVVPLLDDHIAETEASMASRGSPAAAGTRNQGPGEEGGNAIAGQLGGLLGG